MSDTAGFAVGEPCAFCSLSINSSVSVVFCEVGSWGECHEAVGHLIPQWPGLSCGMSAGQPGGMG